MSASHSCTRATLPSRKLGVPETSPVKGPSGVPSAVAGSVAIRCSMPKALAIGRVTKLLVAVTTQHRSPASRCLQTSAWAWGVILGRIVSRMNSACHWASVSREWAASGARAKRRKAWMSSVPDL